MTPRRTGIIIRKVRDISVGTALSISLLAGISLQSCSGSNTQEYETVEEVVYTKGVRMDIQETSPGIFKIINERNVAADSSAAVVTYADGHTDTLTPEAARALIDKKIETDKTMIGVDNSLANALLFGGMGYVLGNQLNHGYLNQYRNDFYKAEPTAQSAKDSTNKNNQHRRHGGIGWFPIFYASRQIFSQSAGITNNVQASRTTRNVSRPIGSRGGFFGGRGRSGIG